MSDEYAIRVQDVSKMYKLYGKNSDRVRDALGLTRNMYAENGMDNYRLTLTPDEELELLMMDM